LIASTRRASGTYEKGPENGAGAWPGDADTVGTETVHLCDSLVLTPAPTWVNQMPLLIGVVLALLAAVAAIWIGLERRTFYSTVLVIVGSYYVLFAVMGASSRVLVIELVAMSLFAVMAAIGFRTSIWIVVAGLALHGAFDFVHGRLVMNPGVPVWWPAFCGSYDVAAAIALAYLVHRAPEPSEFHLNS
jgi:hypothetical protein